MSDVDAPGVARLERELRDLGRALDTGSAPDLTSAVRSALADPGRRPTARTGRGLWPARPTAPAVPGRRPRGRDLDPARGPARGPVRRRVGAGVLAVALALGGTLAVSPAARAVAVRLLWFAGIEVRDEPAPAPRGSGALPGERALTLQEARRSVTFPVLAPPREPDRVAVSDGGRVVTLWYSAEAGQPAVRIDQSGQELETFFRKYSDPAIAEYVDVNGSPGVWVRTPHDVAYVDAGGRILPETVRLSAATLVWQTGTTTLRLEGARTLEGAVRLAGTLQGPAAS